MLFLKGMIITMFKIAVCDNSSYDRDRIKALIFPIAEKLKLDVKTFIFENGVSLYNALQAEYFDMIFLEILLEDVDGIEVAKKIRSMGVDSKLIFVSSYDLRLRELFAVDTSAFLDKPINKNDFEKAFIRIYNAIISKNSKIFTYSINKTKKFIPINDILYIESELHFINIHTTKNKIIRCNSTLKKAWETLHHHDIFIMPHKSYIVNLIYCDLKNSTTIAISPTLSISIGRSFKENTLNRYMLYIQRHENKFE